MIGLRFRFPANRYHATPWDRQVNEGAVEWPPAPWRLLRALVAVWHRKCPEFEDTAELRNLVERLGGGVPSYRLPGGTRAHLRHFMPLYKYKKGRQKTTKVFDAFVHVERDGTLDVVWDLELTQDQERLLEILVSRLGYLGRAESWVSGEVLADDELSGWEANCVPRDEGSTGGDAEQGEAVRVLAATGPEAYETWRDRQIEEYERRILAEKRKKGQNEKITAANQREIDGAIPDTLYDALTSETSLLSDYGYNRPPGSRWLDYVRLAEDEERHVSRIEATAMDDWPTVARYQLVTNAPPRLTDAVAVGDATRRALLKKSDGHPVFAGRDEDDEPLEGHVHTHIIPEALGEHGHVTHLTLSAPMGFDDDALAALSRLRKVWRNRAPEFEFRVVLLGTGGPDDFAGHNRRAGQSPALCESAVWVSRTPFVPTRHVKRRNDGTPKVDEETGYVRGGPRHDLHRLVLERGLPRPESISAVEDGPQHTMLGGKKTRWLEFRTIRPNGSGKRSTARGFGFRIEFPEPVRGPLCFGYGAHYGLGRFVPGE